MDHSTAQRHDEYRQTLLDYYEEEVMGEAYFYALAEHFDSVAERKKLCLLAEVERCAARAVEPLLAKYDLTSRDPEVLKSLGVSDVAAHKDYEWREFVDYIVVRYPGYIDQFEALERLAPEEDLPHLKRLTRHEVVTIEFAVKEAAGETDSAAPLHGYLEECARTERN